MLIAAYNDSLYDVFLFVHVITAVIAIAPAVVHPILLELEKRREEPDVPALATRMVASARIYVIALVVAGVLGIGLISLSDGVIEWGDTWVWLSILVWVVLNGLLHGGMLPAERAMAEGDEAGLKRADTFGPILALMVLLLLYLMVVKPGGGGL